MSKLFNRLFCVLAVFLMVLPLVSCGGGGSSGTAGTTGTLGIGLTDAPGDYLNVFVTIDEIQVKQGLDDGESGWLTVLTPGQTFDLLVLQNGVIADLGLAELEAGQYNQMRLILGELPETSDHPFANYLIIEGESEPVELKVPSGYQTGIKIVQGFNIEVAGSTELILDFNAEKSVVQAGKSGNWLLKPTIKVLETVTYSVSGVVNTVVETVPVPINGATVSAQVYDSGTGDISVAGGTTTDFIDPDEGAYKMYLPISQDMFNIVATMDGYSPECLVLDATSSGIMAYEGYNFTLTETAMGSFIASVSGLATAEDSASISIRQEIGSCGMVEVGSTSVINTMLGDELTYSLPVALPVGTYQVVVTAGELSQEINGVEIVEDPAEPPAVPTVLDVVFP